MIISMENSIDAGWISLSTDVFANSNPITRIIAATTRLARYSNLACPYGCSLSAGFSASLNPSNVTMELAASDRCPFLRILIFLCHNSYLRIYKITLCNAINNLSIRLIELSLTGCSRNNKKPAEQIVTTVPQIINSFFICCHPVWPGPVVIPPPAQFVL